MANSKAIDLTGAVERAGRAIVAIHARRRIPSSGVVWRQGVIVTAHHTIQRDQDITITGADGERRPATLAGRDPSTDLAVLRVDAPKLTVAEQAPSDALAVGALALAVGRPGADVTATYGIVSAVGPEWRTWRGGTIDRFVRLDLRVADGFSGGALVTATGAIAGLNTSGLTRGTPITIPAPTIDRVVDQLLAKGHIARAYLGVGVQGPVRLPAALTAKLGLAADLAPIVISVEPDSPADKAGLLIADILVAVDGTPVHDAGDLMSVLSADRIGQRLTARVVRGGELRDLTLTVGERAR